MNISDRTKRPGATGTFRWQFPALERFSLPNGLQVWLVERRSLPLVSATFVLRTGAITDPPGKIGASSLTGDTLDGGTATKDALALSEELEHLGTSFRTKTGHDGTTLSLICLHRNLLPSLRIMAEMLTGATHPIQEVERVRTLRLTAITQQKDRPASLAALAFQRILYGERHPYGTDAGGSDQSVRALLRDDLVKIHSERYRPGNTTLLLIGPVGRQGAEEILRDALSGWEPSTISSAALPVVPATGKAGLHLLDRPASAQSEVRIGKPSLKRNSPDFFPVIVMNRMLGGQFTSRLNATLREKLGFTYGAWSSFGFGTLGGPFMAGAAVETAHTGEAVQEFLRVIEGVQDEGLTEGELRASIDGIAGGFALAFETPGQVASVLANIILYDLPEDYYSTYLDRLNEVSANAVRSVAAKYLGTSTMATVIVGDTQSLLSQLESLHRSVNVATVEGLRL